MDLPKGRLTNQITRIKETIAKVLDRNSSLAEKIWVLFREQGITITSVLMATGMAIGVLVKVLLLGGETAQGGGGKGGDKQENAKKSLRNKLKALASLLGRSGMKAAEALPGIIAAIINWILNRVKEVV